MAERFRRERTMPSSPMTMKLQRLAEFNSMRSHVASSRLRPAADRALLYRRRNVMTISGHDERWAHETDGDWRRCRRMLAPVSTG